MNAPAKIHLGDADHDFRDVFSADDLALIDAALIAAQERTFGG